MGHACSPYTRSKVENERLLLELHHSQGLLVVLFRPGIVLGHGESIPTGESRPLQLGMRIVG